MQGSEGGKYIYIYICIWSDTCNIQYSTLYRVQGSEVCYLMNSLQSVRGQDYMHHSIQGAAVRSMYRTTQWAAVFNVLPLTLVTSGKNVPYGVGQLVEE